MHHVAGAPGCAQCTPRFCRRCAVVGTREARAADLGAIVESSIHPSNSFICYGFSFHLFEILLEITNLQGLQDDVAVTARSMATSFLCGEGNYVTSYPSSSSMQSSLFFTKTVLKQLSLKAS